MAKVDEINRLLDQMITKAEVSVFVKDIIANLKSDLCIRELTHSEIEGLVSEILALRQGRKRGPLFRKLVETISLEKKVNEKTHEFITYLEREASCLNPTIQ